ncbi:MAG: integrase [Gammaproteobacteria bacterium]|nr:integrase [Gammaproteobacteria bacterium]
MDNSFPQIEIIPNQPDFNRVEPKLKSWYKSPRLLVFSIVFLISSLLSLGYVYSRPALYRSYATLLTVAQTAIDQQSSEADVQHVAIQRQILTGQELLNETLARLQQSQAKIDNQSISIKLTIPEVRRLLSVQAVPETNLVELAATGYQPEIFVPLINTWIDVYLERRAEEIRQTTGLTLDALREELTGLEDKILIKRSELEHFRKINNITSLGRENIFENQSLARFKGLNQSLSLASEEAIKTKARLDAVNKAIADGRMVVPSEDKRGMRVLELRLQQLQEQLAEFDRRYTRSYLALQPKLNVLPGQIRDLEKEIQTKRQFGQSIVLSEAEQDFDAAQQSLGEIKKQLEEHKREAIEFSSRFAEHESLLSDLEGLELLQRTTQERLVQIEAKQAEKFPQVKVIERAFLPRDPISPDYTRDAIIAIVGSIILGLLVVWIIEFLTRKQSHPVPLSILGINTYSDSAKGLINNVQQMHEPIAQDGSQFLQHDNSNSLEHHSVEELSVKTLDQLLKDSDIKTKQLISLLLTGLTLEEISQLKSEHFDFPQETLNVPGTSPRSLLLHHALKSLFEDVEPCPAWNNKQTVSIETLKAILVYASVDAGLKDMQKITSEALTYTYIIYLVKQGLRLSELEQITGYIDPTELSKYSRYSPEKRGLSIADINLIYPSLRTDVD